MLLRVPERRRGVPRDDLGPGVHVGRGQLVADLLGDQAAEGDLVLVRLGLGLVQERDDRPPSSPTRRRRSPARRGCRGRSPRCCRCRRGPRPTGSRPCRACVSSRIRLARCSTTSWPLTASTMHPAADLHGDAQAVAADQPLAVVGDGVGGLLQVERGVDLVREPLELVPEPLLRHHLPHLAVLEVLCRPGRRGR